MQQLLVSTECELSCVFFLLFGRFAVILFWRIELCFTLLSFFTLSKAFLVHSPQSTPHLPLSAWISALSADAPSLRCSLAAHLTVLQHSVLSCLRWKLRFSPCHVCGQQCQGLTASTCRGRRVISSLKTLHKLILLSLYWYRGSLCAVVLMCCLYWELFNKMN